MIRRVSVVVPLAVLVLWTAVPRPFAQTATTQATAPTPVTLGRVAIQTYDFREAGVEVEYALYVPTSYDRSRPSPLIVALHGLGSNPRQIMGYRGLTDLAEARGYIVAAPMGYNSRGWYGSLGPGRPTTQGPAANDPENLGALSEQDVMNVLARVRDQYSIDPRRIFLFGHSMGGGGTLHLGVKNPTLFAALAVVAPAIYSSPDALEAIRGVPVIVIHGDADDRVDVAISRRWVDKMKALGMKYEYIEIPDGDHTGIITRDPANMAKIFDFFDQPRD
jgi:poly(3-hydroxybutyrate) depolymerase